MALIRVISKVGKDGRIKLPANIQRAAGLREGRWIEMKVVGSGRKVSILMIPRCVAKKALIKSLRREK
jgi:bifunctional DNA-binding transcriptional regulator/antitoxin component of YhaV-PrlF toxin-antitoxin module